MTSNVLQQNPIQLRSLCAGALRVALRTLQAGCRRRTTRRQLASLTPAQLRDVGIDPDTIAPAAAAPRDPRLMSRLMSLY